MRSRIPFLTIFHCSNIWIHCQKLTASLPAEISFSYWNVQGRMKGMNNNPQNCLPTTILQVAVSFREGKWPSSGSLCHSGVPQSLCEADAARKDVNGSDVRWARWADESEEKGEKWKSLKRLDLSTVYNTWWNYEFVKQMLYLYTTLRKTHKILLFVVYFRGFWVEDVFDNSTRSIWECALKIPGLL